ncbi:MAG: hypothetical protein CMH53_04250 [Myxococcales bacterium]|jgi:hypothetical protein|nr:hypothetical protein [Myxococcales bacterium]|tara:strand:- start:618 stop:857 length:240 start_codon:yes stop_codon:yes gene_type:complete
MIDLSNQAIRESFDAMLEAVSEVISPEELVIWHHRIENCDNLSQAAEVTTQMIGRPMSDEERQEADEVRQSLILYGEDL